MKRMLAALAMAIMTIAAFAGNEEEHSLALTFRQEVDLRLDVPPEVQARYADLLASALHDAQLNTLASQYIAVVDRNPHVQAIFIYYIEAMPAPDLWRFIGASPVSTGKPGRIDYFVTPTGVFAHSLENPDFRAEGTTNKHGIRGYGKKGMRVYDFGWAMGERGWGAGGLSIMRLQMHATDPDLLEPRLGQPGSKGCVRIPATLNDFFDRHGLLDSDYLRRLAEGKQLWVLRPDRTPTSTPGRYLVILDSGVSARPAWLPKMQYTNVYKSK